MRGIGAAQPRECELDVRVHYERCRDRERVVTTAAAFAFKGISPAVRVRRWWSLFTSGQTTLWSGEALRVTIDAREDGVREALSEQLGYTPSSKALQESTFFQLNGHIFGFYEAELDLVINGQPCVMTNHLNLIEGEQED